MIRSLAILPPFVLSATLLSAQTPVQPYDATGRYRTSGIEVQLTGSFGGGRDVLLSWGNLAVGGAGGRWMQRNEIVAGVHAGQNFVNRLLVGPRVSLGFAMPEWYTEMERGTRAEPYLLLSGAAYGVAGVEDDETELGIAPAVSLAVGLRMFDDEWDISLTSVEVAVQQRFGVAEQAPQVYVRFSRALPRRRPARAPDPHPAGPAPLPPPPPR